MVIEGSPCQLDVPSWAPACAGVVLPRADSLEERRDLRFVLVSWLALDA
jgi:hypothetical protein